MKEIQKSKFSIKTAQKYPLCPYPTKQETIKNAFLLVYAVPEAHFIHAFQLFLLTTEKVL